MWIFFLGPSLPYLMSALVPWALMLKEVSFKLLRMKGLVFWASPTDLLYGLYLVSKYTDITCINSNLMHHCIIWYTKYILRISLVASIPLPQSPSSHVLGFTNTFCLCQGHISQQWGKRASKKQTNNNKKEQNQYYQNRLNRLVH